MCKSREYWVWANLNQRCRDQKQKSYKNYGGRGISVCERWKTSFEAFFADMGPRPSALHSIERKNNEGPYSPENCVWAIKITQQRNTRTNVFISYRGVTKCIAEWAPIVGLKQTTLAARLRHGWSTEKAMTEPLRVRNRIY